MRTLSPWLHKRASAFGSDRQYFATTFDFTLLAQLLWCSCTSQICLTVTTLMPPGHVLRVWRSSLQALGHINRSSAWPLGAGDLEIVSEENPPKKKVKEWNLTRADNGIVACVRGTSIAALSFRTFRNMKKKLMKTTRLGFPMTCALSYISIWLVFLYVCYTAS